MHAKVGKQARPTVPTYNVFYRKDDAVFSSKRQRSPRVVDGFARILHLENPALRRPRCGVKVIPCHYKRARGEGGREGKGRGRRGRRGRRPTEGKCCVKSSRKFQTTRACSMEGGVAAPRHDAPRYLSSNSNRACGPSLCAYGWRTSKRGRERRV